MRALLICVTLLFANLSLAATDYERNKAVPVDKVLFGKVTSVRRITETELLQDRNHGWKVFGGALVGGTIGNQFGSGSGRTISTILGAMLGSSIASNDRTPNQQITIELVELMISIDNGDEYMVVQDLDQQMLFHPQDKIRMIYLSDGSVRIDKQF